MRTVRQSGGKRRPFDKSLRIRTLKQQRNRAAAIASMAIDALRRIVSASTIEVARGIAADTTLAIGERRYTTYTDELGHAQQRIAQQKREIRRLRGVDDGT